MDRKHSPNDIRTEQLDHYQQQDLEVKNKILMVLRDILGELEGGSNPNIPERELKESIEQLPNYKQETLRQLQTITFDTYREAYKKLDPDITLRSFETRVSEIKQDLGWLPSQGKE